MKKYLFGIVCLLVATILIGCAKDDNTDNVFYTGSVIEIRDGEFDLEFDNNGVVDTVIVISDEKDIKEGDNVSVQTNGAVMLSEPPKVNAISVEKIENENENVKLECSFFERVDDQYIIVADREVTEGDMIYTYKVDVSQVDKIPDIPFGIEMIIEYNGIMTKSNPPILTAQSIEIDFPER